MAKYKFIVNVDITSFKGSNVSYNIKDNKNFSLGYYDKVNR